jgi:hypothetical protein
VVDHALLIDFEYPSRNDFLVVSQFHGVREAVG